MHLFGISRLEDSRARGVHLFWTGARGYGFAPMGFELLRRDARQWAPRHCTVFAGAVLQQLRAQHVARFDGGIARFRTAPCPTSIRRAPCARESANCEKFRFDFSERHPGLDVSVFGGFALAIAFRDGKAVAAATDSGNDSPARARLRAAGMDRIDVYTRRAKRIDVCSVDEHTKALLEDWGAARVLAKLQLPLRELQPSLPDAAAELAQARPRMLDPERLDADSLESLLKPWRAAVVSGLGLPEHRIWLTRDSSEDDLIELPAIALGSATAIDPDGRRLLGLAHVDREDLEPGRAYDYRIVARYPRIDLEDEIISLERIPPGAALPPRFHLGSVYVQTSRAPSVVTRPAAPPDALTAIGRRGIELPPFNDAPPLRLELAAPVTELTLAIEAPAGPVPYRAQIAGSYPPSYVTGTTVPGVPLAFATPIEAVELIGESTFFGLRLHATTGPDRRPEELAEATADAYGIVFEATDPPDPPSSVDIDNLQTPPAPGPLEDTLREAPHELGFRIRWTPATSGGVDVWPPDPDAAPPLDNAMFALERRRVDSAAWEPVGPRAFAGNRAARDDLRSIQPGDDLLEIFSDTGRDAAATTDLRFDDAFGDEIPPGTKWQYRAASVDPTGRRSATWTESAPVRLEKRVPPPQPAGPRGETAEARPRGVSARVLQRLDPQLTDAERALVGTHDNAVVLRWSWTDRERAIDRFANQFRVYTQPTPEDVLAGRLTGPAVLDGTRWRVTAELERSVAIDALTGLRLAGSTAPYRIEAHDAGATPTMWLRQLSVDPSLPPEPGPFRVAVSAGGEAVRPALFAERSAVISIDPEQEGYEHVVFDLLAPSPSVPVDRAWVGVSAADAEGYVPDSLPAGVLNGGIPGNESAIAMRAVAARYLGRPEITVPPPLPAVPEILAAEIAGGPVPIELAVPDLIRPTPPPAPERIVVERLSVGDVVRRMQPDPDGAVIALPGGGSAAYAPENPDDRVALSTQLQSGNPALVDARFARDVVLRFPAAFAEEFERTGGAQDFDAAPDLLPPTPERYLYRIKAADAADRVSEPGVLLDAVVRVPSPRRPAPPRLSAAARTDDDRTVARVSVRPAFDLAWVAVFAEAGDIGDPTPRVGSAALTRLANRPDLYPAGIQLRVGSETLTPAAVPIPTPPDDSDFVDVEVEVSVGRGKRVRLWAVAVTRDGVPSELIGPVTQDTGPEELVAPALTLDRLDGSHVRAEWSPVAGQELRIERRATGGEWKPATSWLGSGNTSVELLVRDAAELRALVRDYAGGRGEGAAVPLPDA